jgi:hypothetical protein
MCCIPSTWMDEMKWNEPCWNRMDYFGVGLKNGFGWSSTTTLKKQWEQVMQKVGCTYVLRRHMLCSCCFFNTYQLLWDASMLHSHHNFGNLHNAKGRVHILRRPMLCFCCFFNTYQLLWDTSMLHSRHNFGNLLTLYFVTDVRFFSM